MICRQDDRKYGGSTWLVTYEANTTFFCRKKFLVVDKNDGILSLSILCEGLGSMHIDDSLVFFVLATYNRHEKQEQQRGTNTYLLYK